ncbi:MAG: hypothetical protein HUK01_04440 [Bacteroidaceae bacterium]|nr:hypothetical protein [Bacteroidaceae bacterium]
MPRIVDCIKSESETPANVIRLVKVSGGFLRAYNRSAWKFHTFINDYKVKRMFVKSANEEVVSLGFPETSLHALTDGRQMTTTDLGFDLMLKPGETLRADDYEAWVAAIPVTNNSRSDYEACPLSGPEAEREVLRRLMQFPVERRSPLDCQAFLSELREMLVP